METLTKRQAAERLNISVRTFERLRSKEQIPAPIYTLKMRPILWDADDIDALKG
jgi:hypothetical protein